MNEKHLAIAALLIAAAIAGYSQLEALHVTEEVEFCDSCHYVETNSTVPNPTLHIPEGGRLEEGLASRHYNTYFPENYSKHMQDIACHWCHSEPGYTGKVNTLIAGSTGLVQHGFNYFDTEPVMFDKENPFARCSWCHKKNEVQKKHGKNGSIQITNKCYDCHSGHEAQHKEVQHEIEHKQNLTGKAEVCLNCHVTEHEKYVEEANKEKGSHVEEENCKACHPGKPANLIKFSLDNSTANEVCKSCHNLTWKKWTNAPPNKHKKKQTCAECHSPTHGTTPDCRDCHGGAEADRNKKCLSCHRDPHYLRAGSR